MNFYSPMQDRIVHLTILSHLTCVNCNSGTLLEPEWEAIFHCIDPLCGSKFWSMCPCHIEGHPLFIGECARFVEDNGQCKSCNEFVVIGQEVEKFPEISRQKRKIHEING
jgi:hypothetical protein